MTDARVTWRLVAAGVLCVALTFGGQALADSLVPEASGVETNRAVVDAAGSYLTGLRTYAAAALWNRLDPVMHGYYSGTKLGEMRYMLSTIALVEALDPQLIFAYPVGSWILVENDRVDDGIAMAERGVESNPRSGLLLMNLAQLQMLYGDDLPGAVETAERGLAEDIVWTDAAEKHVSYPIFGAIFRAAGREDLDAIVQTELTRIDEEMGAEIAPEDHDHDHDGVPDH